MPMRLRTPRSAGWEPGHDGGSSLHRTLMTNLWVEQTGPDPQPTRCMALR
jgi:hypothetical protein